MPTAKFLCVDATLSWDTSGIRASLLTGRHGGPWSVVRSFDDELRETGASVEVQGEISLG